MTYLYKKSDKDFNNPIELKECVRFKTLYNKSEKILNELNSFMYNNLMFDYEDSETKDSYYKAIDNLKDFQENLKVKKGYKNEYGAEQ